MVGFGASALSTLLCFQTAFELLSHTQLHSLRITVPSPSPRPPTSTPFSLVLGWAMLNLTALPWFPELLTHKMTAPQMLLKLHTCKRHLIVKQLAVSCMPQLPLVLTSLILSLPSHNFSITPALFIGRLSSMSSATWLAPETVHSSMVVSGMTSLATLMQMVLQRSIAMRSLDTLFLLTEEPSLGTHANRKLSPCLQPKQNTLQQHMPQKKPSSYAIFSSSFFHSPPLLPSSTVTTKLPSNLLLMTTTIPTQNTSNIHYHFIQQVIADGTITLIYCPTDDRAARFSHKSLTQVEGLNACLHTWATLHLRSGGFLPCQGLCIAHLMHHCSLGLNLETAPYPIFGPPHGLRAHLLYNLSILSQYNNCTI